MSVIIPEYRNSSRNMSTADIHPSEPVHPSPIVLEVMNPRAAIAPPPPHHPGSAP